jgi:hypothetical protein
VAGTGVNGPVTGDGGAAKRAVLAFPSDVAADAYGSIYVLDGSGSRIRKIGRTG